MGPCDAQETSKNIASLKIDFITISKLAETATWSSGRSPVDIMTVLLIALIQLQLTTLRLCSNTFSTLGFIIWVGRTKLKVSILPKIRCQVGRAPWASIWREQEQCFLKSNTEGSNIYMSDLRIVFIII